MLIVRPTFPVLLSTALLGGTSLTHAEPVQLDTLVIYGSKVSKSIADTTASVAIVGEEDIEFQQLKQFRDAFRTMGNVMDADWVDAGFVIRGVNSEGLTPGGAPLASFYIDGIEQTVNGTRRGARGLWDVEQVEVYRGPQSTLTGRAALAGAIYVKTKDPVFENEGAVMAGLGDDDYREGAVMLNVPVAENQLAVRLAAEYRRRDTDLNYPTYEAFDNFEDFARNEYYQIRAKALYLPDTIPDTSFALTLSTAYDSPTIDDIAGPALGFDFDERRGDFNLPVFTEQRETRNHNAGLEIVHDINPDLALTSLTSYSDSDLSRDSVNAGTAGESNVLFGDQDQELITQEVRLNYGNGQHTGVLGLYLAQEEADADFVRPDFFGRRDTSKQSTEAQNIALFGEVVYAFSPSWKAVVGARADYSESEFTSSFEQVSGGSATVTRFKRDVDEFAFLPKLGLIKQIAPTQSVDFTVQRGFRAGGAGLQRSTGETFEFDPEFTTNYEIGYRGEFLDGRLSARANLFYSDWEDQQVEQLEVPGDFTSSRTVNAAESESKGFEIELDFRATSQLTTYASIGYVDTEFKDFDSASLGDLSGSEFPEAPSWNIGLGARYEIGNGLFIGADLEYTDDHLARFGLEPQESVDSRSLVNLQAGYRGPKYEVVGYVENLLDEDYFVYSDNDIAATLGKRRAVGITGKLLF